MKQSLGFRRSSRGLFLLKYVAMLLLISFAGCGGANSPQPAGDSGATGNEQAAGPALFDPLPRHPQLELSNLRFQGGDSFDVDWRLVSGEGFGTYSLAVVPTGQSYPLEMSVTVWDGQKSGSFSGAVQSFGFGGEAPPLSSGCEMYLVSQEGDAKFKISNSITSGSAGTSPTRQATAAELQALAPPSEEGLEAVPTDIVVPLQTKLMAKHNNKFHSVTVIEALDDGQLRIKWDEEGSEGVYPRSSLRIKSDVLAAMPRTPFVAKSNTGRPHPANNDTAAPENLVAIPADLDVPKGTPLRAHYNGRWLPVTALAAQPDGGIKIHWDDYGDAWDEVKPRADLRIEAATLKKLQTGAPTAESTAGDDKPAAFKPGQKVEAQYAGDWLPAIVKRVLPDGTVEIHWEGYADSFDEAVPASQLRPPRN